MSEHPLLSLLETRQSPEIITYWTSVGRFMTEFADTESILQISLWTLADTSTKTARAIFSGVRIDSAISFIRRILEAHETEKISNEAFEYIFKQLQGITKIRNDIVHYGPEWKEGRKSVSVGNRLTAHIPSRRSETNLTPSDLDLMSLDLQKIRMHLWCLIIDQKKPSPWQLEVLQSPWLYKLPAQGNNQRKKTSKTPNPPDPRKRPR